MFLKRVKTVKCLWIRVYWFRKKERKANQKLTSIFNFNLGWKSNGRMTHGLLELLIFVKSTLNIENQTGYGIIQWKSNGRMTHGPCFRCLVHVTLYCQIKNKQQTLNVHKIWFFNDCEKIENWIGRTVHGPKSSEQILEIKKKNEQILEIKKPFEKSNGQILEIRKSFEKSNRQILGIKKSFEKSKRQILGIKKKNFGEIKRTNFGNQKIIGEMKRTKFRTNKTRVKTYNYLRSVSYIELRIWNQVSYDHRSYERNLSNCV